MATLVLQTILLLLAAYFIGYFAGFFINYAFAGRQTVTKASAPAASAGKAAGGPRSAQETEPMAEAMPAPSNEPAAGQQPAPAKRTASAKGKAKSDSGDDLTRIKGIGPAISKKLLDMDVRRFEQIAGWDEADVERINQQLRFKGRIQRENWIEQAKALAGKS